MKIKTFLWIVVVGCFPFLAASVLIADQANPAKAADAILAFQQGRYVNLGNSESLNPEDQLTLEVWINPAQAGRQVILWRSHTGISVSRSSYALMLDNKGALMVCFAPTRVSGKEPVEPGVWTHVAATFDRGNISLYQDGELVGSDTGDGDLRQNQQHTVIGISEHDGSTRHGMNGSIAEVRIWNTARSQAEIQNSMKKRLRGDEAGLAGYWPINEGAGSIVYDRTANKLHGISLNAEWDKSSGPGLLPCQTDSAVTAPLIKHAVYDNPAGSIPVLLEILADTDETEVVLEEVFGLFETIGPDAKNAISAHKEASGIFSQLVLNTLRPLELRMNAMALHPDPAATAPLLIANMKDEEHDNSVRLSAIKLMRAGGADIRQAIAGNPDAVLTLEALTSPLTPNGALRQEACKILADIELDLPDHVNDWPMWQYDVGRTGKTPVALPETLHLQWIRELPEPKRAWPHQWDDQGKLEFDLSYAPVVKGDKIFVPSMVADSVTAYRTADGTEVWRFYADGPVRLAPVAWNDKVYFVSDDGHLYCVHAESGELAWKFHGGASAHRLLGNERIINFWPARGGPVIQDDTVYFAAGIWPLHGIFIYALNPENGEVKWVNDTTSSDYVDLPHGGASGFGGLAPQGYIAINDDSLVVAGGRTPPAYLNRHTGLFEEADFRSGKGLGGYAVHGGGIGFLQNDMLTNLVESLADKIEGKVFISLAARDRLFVTTQEGLLYCFGPEPAQPTRHKYKTAAPAPHTTAWTDAATKLLEQVDDKRGYALVLGAGSGDLLRELLARTEFHIAVVESDAQKVRTLRDELWETGVSGRRAAVINADPATFEVQPYLFTIVISEDAPASGIKADADSMNRLLDRLRPYGGTAWLGASGQMLSDLYEAAKSAEVDQVSVENRNNHLFATRSGPLTGAGQWTHQYQDAMNSNISRDDLTKLPLGVLWFGGPSHDNILPRHSSGPRPQVAGGKIVFLGVETIAARCVYTGRELWERKFPGIGHPFTNLKLEERWAQGESVYMSNIPGATFIGSPFVTLPDSIYLRHAGRIHKLDPATGKTLAEITPPGRPVSKIYDDENAPEWGHVSVQGEYLIATSEPHLFEDQALGWPDSYSGTSSKRIAVMDRLSGNVHWEREARAGFRHNAIVASHETLYLIDGLSKNAVAHLARRGKEPEETSEILAISLKTGEIQWRSDSKVFGTLLQYSEAHDILIEGGMWAAKGGRTDDEPRNIAGRRGKTGEILWEAEFMILPGALNDEMLIGSPDRLGGHARSLLTGELWTREQPHADEDATWNFRRAHGCGKINASTHLLLFRSGYASFFDLEHDSGTGNLSGFRSGCTSSMVAADGILNALDYTRTCTCSYANQTSLALIHMPAESNIEFWTRRSAKFPDPTDHGLNFGAPGRRVDVEGGGRVWYDQPGTHRRHPSAVKTGAGPAWVASSAREFDGNGSITLNDLPASTYTIRLHFAELNQDVKPGQRVFNVLINGRNALEGFDIVAKTGSALHGNVELFTIEADEAMTIEFIQAEGSKYPPIINGIEISRKRGGE